MAKINIRTLNGIRSAAAPKGRDVAEAFDDVVATVNKLATSVAALVPNEPIQTVQISKPTSGVTQNPAPGASAGGGSGPSPSPTVVLQVVAVTGNYTSGPSDYCVEVTATANCTIQLTGVQMAWTVTVKNYSASGIVVTIEDADGGTVDGAASVQMEWNGTSATFIYDGTSNWVVS
jgi:hypothetical protein